MGRGVLWTVYAAAFAAGGWWIGQRYWDESVGGVFVGLAVAALVAAFFGEHTRPVMLLGTAFLLAGVPTIYALVLLAQLPVLAAGQLDFSPRAFFRQSLLGAVVGTALMVLYGIRGTFNAAIEPRHGGRFNRQEHFVEGMSLRIAVAFLVACLFVLPNNRPIAMIMLGTMWGIVVAAVQAVFTVLVDGDPIRDGWARVIGAECVLGLGLVVGVLSGLFDHPMLWGTLQLVPAAAATCAAAYGLLHLAGAGLTRIRGR